MGARPCSKTPVPTHHAPICFVPPPPSPLPHTQEAHAQPVLAIEYSPDEATANLFATVGGDQVRWEEGGAHVFQSHDGNARGENTPRGAHAPLISHAPASTDVKTPPHSHLQANVYDGDHLCGYVAVAAQFDSVATEHSPGGVSAVVERERECVCVARVCGWE